MTRDDSHPGRFDPFDVHAPLVLPSILSADFTRLGHELDDVRDAGCQALHLDVMDGHFVGSTSFGVPVIRGVRKHAPDAFLDVHLMVTNPVEAAATLGDVDAVSFHAEVATNVRHTVASLARGVRDAVRPGVRVGVALNPATPVEAVLGVVMSGEVDYVLVMSVVPGASGQAFKREVLQKCEALAGRLSARQRLEIDGGINPDTAGHAAAAGVDWLVAASAVFGQSDRKHAVRSILDATTV